MKPVLLILLVCISLSVNAQNSPPKREFRGAWIATFANIDITNFRTHAPQRQRDTLLRILDHHQATGINTIFFQVRSNCDAMYQSSIEPYSIDFTNTQGKAPVPFWDPLAFMIEECHKRGMELHAWINPYRAISNFGIINTYHPDHVARKQPTWLLAHGIIRVLNPGLPEVRDYITSVVVDIVNRYDVDGIHFDDYFYPSGIATTVDDATFAAYPRGFTNRGDWRRDNVNLLIKRINDTINSLKPWVKYGVSPSGIYRNSTNPAIGSATAGAQHYADVFADSKKWLAQGWVDYLAPQVYWYIGQPAANYEVVVKWWNLDQSPRHKYIGMAGYKVNDASQGAPWTQRSHFPNEVRMNRSLPNISGQAVYNTSSLRSLTRLDFRDSLRLHFYNKPSLLPLMAWKDAVAPAQATALKAVREGDDYIQLTWTQPTPATSEMDKVKRYVIYRAESPVLNLNDANAILAITPLPTDSFRDETIEAGRDYYYAVTALDRFHNESIVSNTSDYKPPVIQCPGAAERDVDAACAVAVPDFRGEAIASDDLSLPENIRLTQVPAAGTPLYGLGTFTITLTATDDAGNESSCSFTLTTKDVTAPVITVGVPNPSTLWPPNHKMRTIAIPYSLWDNCTPATSTLSVTSNEPENGLGDGDTGPDWEVLNNHQVKLRAERSGTGSGRIYTITVTAKDASGNMSSENMYVTVPHDRDPQPVTQSRPDETVVNPNGLTVLVRRNPSPSYFELATESVSGETLRIRVTDATGRLVESRQGVTPGTAFTLGANYAPGLYYMEVIQGSEKKVLKLVKR